MPTERFRTYAHRTRLSGIAACIVMTLSGCGGSIGPLVADLHWRMDGQLEMTRCMFDVQSYGNMLKYSLRNCTKSMVLRTDIRDPSAAKAATDVVVP